MADGSVCIWDGLDLLPLMELLDAHGSGVPVTALCLRDRATSLLVGLADGTMLCWNKQSPHTARRSGIGSMAVVVASVDRVLNRDNTLSAS